MSRAAGGGERPRYVPPQLGSRLSHAAAAALEGAVAFPPGFERLLDAAPRGGTRLELGLGGGLFAVDATPRIAGLLRAGFGGPGRLERPAYRVDVSLGSVSELPFDTPITRLGLRQREDGLEVVYRGLAARALLVAGGGGRVEAVVEEPGTLGDLSNLVRLLLWLFAPGSGALLLHAAALEAPDGRVDLFFGPSTSGKTTIASLAGSRRVWSDDGVLVRPGDGGVAVESVGLWGGESLEHRSAPARGDARAAFALVKSTEVRLERLTASRAALELAAVVPSVRRGGARRVLELATRIAGSLPCYRLEFRRDAGFWQAIEAELR